MAGFDWADRRTTTKSISTEVTPSRQCAIARDGEPSLGDEAIDQLIGDGNAEARPDSNRPRALGAFIHSSKHGGDFTTLCNLATLRLLLTGSRYIRYIRYTARRLLPPRSPGRHRAVAPPLQHGPPT